MDDLVDQIEQANAMVDHVPAPKALPSGTFAADLEAIDFMNRHINDPEAIKKYQPIGLQRERQSLVGSAQTPEAFLASTMIPFGSAVMGVDFDTRYRRAVDRYNQGKATPTDLEHIAGYERLKEIEANETTGQKLLRSVARIPAIVGESMIGGQLVSPLSSVQAAPAIVPQLALSGARLAATTAVTPSLYAPEASRRAVEQGGSPISPKNIGPAFAMGAAQNAVLGSLGRFGGSIPTVAGRIAAKTALGVTEQAAVDTAAGAADEFLPEQWQTKTRYGLVGHLARGERGPAMQRAILDTATFAVFSALHANEGNNRAREIVPAAGEFLDEAAKSGQPAKEAAATLGMINREMAAAREHNATPEELQKIVDQLPEGPARDYAKTVGDAILNTTVPEPPSETPPPKTPPGATPEPSPPQPAPAPEAPPEPPKPFDGLQADVIEQLSKSLTGKPIKTAAGLREELSKRGSSESLMQQLSDAASGKPPAPAAPEPARKMTMIERMRQKQKDVQSPTQPDLRGKEQLSEMGHAESPVPQVIPKIAERLLSEWADTDVVHLANEFQRRAGDKATTMTRAEAEKWMDENVDHLAVRLRLLRAADVRQSQRERLTDEEHAQLIDPESEDVQHHDHGQAMPEDQHPDPDVAANARILRYRLASFSNVIETAIADPSPANREAVQSVLERLRKIAASRGLDYEKLVADKLPRYLEHESMLRPPKAAEAEAPSPENLTRGQKAAETRKQAKIELADLRARYDDVARQLGVDPADLHAEAERLMADDKAAVLEFNAMLKHARKYLDRFGKTHRIMGARDTIAEDANAIAGLDVVGRDMQEMYPQFFATSGEDPGAALFEMLKTGRRATMAPEDAYRKAADVIEHHIQGSLDDAITSAERAGHSSAEIENAIRTGEEAGAVPPDEATTAGDAFEGASSGDTSFEFGANAGGGSQTEPAREFVSPESERRGEMDLFGNRLPKRFGSIRGEQSSMFVGDPSLSGPSPEFMAAAKDFAKEKGGNYQLDAGGRVRVGDTWYQSEFKDGEWTFTAVERTHRATLPGGDKPESEAQNAAQEGVGQKDNLQQHPAGNEAWKTPEAGSGDRNAGSGEGKKTGRSQEAVNAIADGIRDLYDRSGIDHATMDLNMIDAKLRDLNGLKVSELQTVAERMEISGAKGKSKDAILKAIRQKIIDRRSSAQREDMINEGRPGAEAAPTRPDPTDPGVEFAKEVIRDEAGHYFPEQVVAKVAEFADKAHQWYRYFRFQFQELGGKAFPRTTELSERVGEAMARDVAANEAARRKAPYFIDQIMGKNATAADRVLYGTTLMEMRFRFAIKQFIDKANAAAIDATLLSGRAKVDKLAEEAEYRQKAKEVRTFVGQKNSPLATNADFLRVLADPRFNDVLNRFKQIMVPEIEKNYRGAMGLDQFDPINSLTQLPGLPFNALPLKDGSMGHNPLRATDQRGDLRNIKIPRYKFAKEASLNAEMYDTDLGAMIENSLAHGYRAARRAEAFRIAAEEGIGFFGKPGENHEGYRVVPGANPPLGTQAAARGETSWYIHEQSYPEWYKMQNLDRAWRPVPLAQALNWLTLQSVQELAYHSKNQLTFLGKPGVRITDLVRNAADVILSNNRYHERINELAENMATKPIGDKPAGLWGSALNPFRAGHNVLEKLSDVMRLTASDAFDRLAGKKPDLLVKVATELNGGRPLVEDTWTNKRDFINQLGNYHSRAQNDVVRFLRETGVGPFAVAGTNYLVDGLRMATFSPGVKATSTRASAMLRVEQMSKVVGTLATVGLLNYLLWGRVDGDDQTPLGAIKLGTKGNKTVSLDVADVIGVKRGARTIGLDAAIEHQRAGDDFLKTRDAAVRQSLRSLTHPAAGPAVQFANTAITGQDYTGRRVAPPAQNAEDMPNLKAAARAANPLVHAATAGEDRPNENVSTAERVAALLGPFGPKFREDKSTSKFHFKKPKR